MQPRELHRIRHALESIALNSLCGISLNATNVAATTASAPLSPSALNSLCGISLNATEPSRRCEDYPWSKLSIPFVGFLWMQQHASEAPARRRRTSPPLLSIPFVGFLWMQLYRRSEGMPVHSGNSSQFPLWDFFECNPPPEEPTVKFPDPCSQFPLWDFFECNTSWNTRTGINTLP